jgi:hypothetical protein
MTGLGANKAKGSGGGGGPPVAQFVPAVARDVRSIMITFLHDVAQRRRLSRVSFGGDATWARMPSAVRGKQERVETGGKNERAA